jgi:hypothetical protein
MPGVNRIAFKLHQSGGREREFTILGSEEAFESLASQITDALQARREPNSQWGSRLASGDITEVGFPNSTSNVSFVVDGEIGVSAKSWRAAFGNPWAASLSLVGFFALCYAIIKFLL